MRIFRWLPVALLGVMLFLAPAAMAAEKVLVGVLVPLAGDQAPFGMIQRLSCEMAVAKINGQGGVGGVEIKLAVEDTGAGPQAARAAVEKLAGQGAVAVVGGLTDDEALEATAAAQGHKLPFLVTSATADAITAQGRDHVFRLASPASEQLSPLESFFRQVAKVQTAAVLYQNNPTGVSDAARFEALANKLSIRVVWKEGWTPPGKSFTDLLVRVKARAPEVVYVSGTVVEATYFLRQARDMNVTPRLFVGNGAGFDSAEMKLNAQGAEAYAFSTSPWVPTVPGTGAEEYFKEFVQANRVPPTYQGAQAFAAIQVLSDALKRAGGTAPAALRNALAGTDTMTVFGRVKFESFNGMSRQNRPQSHLVQWVDGTMQVVWPVTTDKPRYVYPVPPWKER